MAGLKLNPLSLVGHHSLTEYRPSPSTPTLPLLSYKDPSTLSLNSLTLLPKISSTTAINRNEGEKGSSFDHYYCQEAHSLSVAFPALAFSNTLFFASNVRLAVGEDDNEEKLIGRFRREVMKAGVLRECRRRRFFESSQEKRKRKSREAARRNRKSRPQPKDWKKDKAETSSKKNTQDSDEVDDNWEFLDIDLPYC